MADESADGDLERSGQGWADEDTFYAMESLQATLQHFEAVLRQRDISEASSIEYCDNFCQALMHYAGSRNSVEHGLTLLEVYCLSINCFASARPHLTDNSSSVALVLKRLALQHVQVLQRYGWLTSASFIAFLVTHWRFRKKVPPSAYI